MDLVLQIDLASDRHGSRYACGIVVTDNHTARTLHEVGHVIDEASSVLAADFAALHHGLELIAPMQPDTLEIRCVSQALVEHLTGIATPSDTALQATLQRVLEQLLQIDNWQFTRVDREAKSRSVQLANSALVDDDDVVAMEPVVAEKRQRREHTGVPQWTVELLEDPGVDCPARCVARRKYPFGPDVPAGFCVHAARVVLTDGPLTWTDPDLSAMTTLCPHCDVSMRIQCVDR
ncbi:MAG: reverse transcriptase-like protein [Phycisphaera sp.]|nr:reverse transcriptase-like protein [Phycisphaera sp.]